MKKLQKGEWDGGRERGGVSRGRGKAGEGEGKNEWYGEREGGRDRMRWGKRRKRSGWDGGKGTEEWPACGGKGSVCGIGRERREG